MLVKSAPAGGGHERLQLLHSPQVGCGTAIAFFPSFLSCNVSVSHLFGKMVRNGPQKVPVIGHDGPIIQILFMFSLQYCMNKLASH